MVSLICSRRNPTPACAAVTAVDQSGAFQTLERRCVCPAWFPAGARRGHDLPGGDLQARGGEGEDGPGEEGITTITVRTREET